MAGTAAGCGLANCCREEDDAGNSEAIFYHQAQLANSHCEGSVVSFAPRTALGRQVRCFVCCVPRWGSSFRPISMKAGKDDFVASCSKQISICAYSGFQALDGDVVCRGL
jgi:hypothetical protein